MKRTIAAVLVALAVPSVAQAQTLTVYSSLPLSGFPAANTKAINAGARIALQQSGNASVRLVTLNTGSVNEQAAANARTAALDASTIAYIGDYYSAATRLALPVLNQGGVPAISPTSTYKGLTVGGPGTRPGEPNRFYGTGVRNFFRLVPNDAVQAAALATAMRDKGCTRIAVHRGPDLYGRGLAADIRSNAARLGLRVVGLKRANCLVFAGGIAYQALDLFRTAPKRLKLFGGDGLGSAEFAAQLPRSVARRTFVTADVLAPAGYGLPAHTNSYLAFGYEAMKVILDGIAAGATTKPALIAWLHTVQNRPSALGTYGFDANGDTTLRTIGLYRISNYALRFVGPITAA